jgi:uncharacterized repeat protein (TIGR01451 family)
MPKIKSISYLPSLLLLLLLLTLLPVTITDAQTPAPPAPLSLSASTLSPNPFLLQDAEPRVYRITYSDLQELHAITQRFDVWEVDREQREVVAQMLPQEASALEQAGRRVEVDIVKSARLNRPLVPLAGQTSGIPGYPCYRTVEETYATAESIVATYPQLATWTDIGDSWEKTQNAAAGYDLMVLRLTNSAVTSSKPKLFVMASMHARELTPAELATRFAERLVQNYDVDPDVTWLLDYHEIHLLLQANPDGRKQAETGLSWRKNTNESYCLSDPRYRGADLNRNYEFQWGCCGGSSTNPCYDTYRGPGPASEPETQAVQAYVRAEFPDQRDDALADPAPDDATGVFLDLHSYSRLVLWPWGFTYDPAPNGPALQTLGRKFAYFNGYTPSQSTGLYRTDGTTDNLAYGELGLAAYTFELGTSFFQSCSHFENSILSDNLDALLYAAKVARTPYQTPAGPDALNLGATSVEVPRGEPFTLTATLDDTRYNQTNGTEATQNIAAAEYYVDIPPWVSPTPVAHTMEPADGAFDEKVESVSASIDTAALAEGRHTLFVRGRDAAGNWGPVSALFIEVLPPPGPPLFTLRKAPSHAPVEAGTPLTYTLLLTNTGGYPGRIAITDTLPAGTLFAWAGEGGSLVGDAVEWRDLSLTSGAPLAVTYGVTVSCVPSGTQIVNDAYQVTASEWPTPTLGLPVTVTAQSEGVVAAFDVNPPALTGWPLPFNNLSIHATAFEWDFGDGEHATLRHPEHSYATVGTFTTTLTATNACSFDTVSHSVDVHTYDLHLSGDAAQRGDPGTTVTHTLRLTNTGTLSDLFHLQMTSNEWTTLPDVLSLTLSPGEGRDLAFGVAIPTEAEGEERDAAHITAWAESDPRSAPARASVPITTVANTVYGVDLAPDRAVYTATRGSTIAHTLQITNTGNVLNTFRLSHSGWGWPTLFQPEQLDIAGGGIRTVDLSITVPPTATTGAYSTTLQAVGQESAAAATLSVRIRYQSYLPLLLRR